MFDSTASEDSRDLLAQVRELRQRLADPPREFTDAQRVELIGALEELKNTACAAQARLSVDFDASQRAAQGAAGVPGSLQGRGVAAQVGLARRESPHRGARYLGLAKVVCAEMPHTHAGMAAGWLSEWRATLLARETACLSVEHRAAVDRELVGDRATELATWSDQQIVAEARKLAYRLDPKAVIKRIGNAVKDRCVTSRPAPDAMAYLTALLPAAQAVACYAALVKAAESARAAGDPRTRGQVMADTLVQLLTGQTTATGTPVEIQLVVTDQTLLANAGRTNGSDSDQTDPREEPGHLHGYGTVPADWIRDLIATLPEQTRAWIRRLYADPTTGQLVAMDSRRRLFPSSIRRFTVIRDQICRTPWCGAPIRHTDHPQDYAKGGATSRANSQGLCEACNYAKQAPGWTARPIPGVRHTVRTTTPTGHVYDSTAPRQPGWQQPPRAERVDRPEALPIDPLDADTLIAFFDHLVDDVDPPVDQAA